MQTDVHHHLANSQKPADVTRKVAHSRANSENYLLFENNRARADDSHYKVSHAFVTNMKIGNVAPVQFSMLSRASHFEQVITRAASWNFPLIYLLRGGNCSRARRRGRMQIDFGVPPSFSLPFPCKLFFPFLNSLWRLLREGWLFLTAEQRWPRRDSNSTRAVT